MTEHAATFWGHVFLFLMGLANLAYQWKREARNHQWQQEQTKSIAQLSDVVKNGHGEKGL